MGREDFSRMLGSGKKWMVAVCVRNSESDSEPGPPRLCGQATLLWSERFHVKNYELVLIFYSICSNSVKQHICGLDKPLPASLTSLYGDPVICSLKSKFHYPIISEASEFHVLVDSYCSTSSLSKYTFSKLVHSVGFYCNCYCDGKGRFHRLSRIKVSRFQWLIQWLMKSQIFQMDILR